MKEYEDMTPEEQAQWDLEEEVFEGSSVRGLATPRQLSGMLDIFERVTRDQGRFLRCSWNDGSKRYGYSDEFNVPSHVEIPKDDDENLKEKERRFEEAVRKEHVFSDSDSKLLADTILFMKDGLETGEIVGAYCSFGLNDFLIMDCAFTKRNEDEFPKYKGACKVDGFATTLLPRKELVKLLATDEKKESDDLFQRIWDDIREGLGLD